MAVRQGESRETRKAYFVAATVLIGLVFVILVPFALLSLIKARSRKDKARRFVPWLKASFFLFAIAAGLRFITAVINTTMYWEDLHEWHLTRASLHIPTLGTLFFYLSGATVMILLLLISPGLHRAIDGITSTFDKAVRFFAYFIGGVVMCLSMALYGLIIDFYINMTNPLGFVDSTAGSGERIMVMNKLESAIDIILFAVSIILTGLSIFAFVERRHSPLKTASIMYLVASLLNLLGSTWTFAYMLLWVLPPITAYTEQPKNYIHILAIIFSYWSRGIVLILCLFLAKKKSDRGGIWSHNGKHGYSSMY